MNSLSGAEIQPLEASVVEPEYVYVRIPRSLYHALKPDIYGNVDEERFMQACLSLAFDDQLKLL